MFCFFSLFAVFGDEKFNFKIITDPTDLMKFVQHLRESNRKVSTAVNYCWPIDWHMQLNAIYVLFTTNHFMTHLPHPSFYMHLIKKAWVYNKKNLPKPFYRREKQKKGSGKKKRKEMMLKRKEMMMMMMTNCLRSLKKKWLISLCLLPK